MVFGYMIRESGSREPGILSLVSREPCYAWQEGTSGTTKSLVGSFDSLTLKNMTSPCIPVSVAGTQESGTYHYVYKRNDGYFSFQLALWRITQNNRFRCYHLNLSEYCWFNVVSSAITWLATIQQSSAFLLSLLNVREYC